MFSFPSFHGYGFLSPSFYLLPGSSLHFCDSMSSELDDEEWITHVRHELLEQTLNDTVDPSIFMVSSPLRGLKLDAFIPQVVAIGPYHCDLGPHHSDFPESVETQRYKAMAAKEMERYKVMVARETARKFKTRDFCFLVDEFLTVIDRVKAQYDSELDWKSDEKLALVLALDASFVVEVLRSLLEMQSNPASRTGYVSKFPRPLRKSVLQDFILLENQIPLFLLLKVIRMDEKCSSDEEAERKLGSMITKVASDILPFTMLHDVSLSSPVINFGRRKHLLDCLYRIVTFRRTSMASKKNEMVEWPTQSPRAVELANSGVKFRGKVGNVLDVNFDPQTAILSLPKIRVGDDTEKLFRNLLAYESHLIDNVEVVSYLRFMNNLVDTPEDVALLVEKGILAQDIGSNEEVAQMWNNLCVNTMRVWSRHYEELSVALNKHCSFKLNALKAEFKAEYLSRPWLVVSLASGSALLIMTFIIMYYTILLYYAGG